MVTTIIVLAVIVALAISWATIYVTNKAYKRKDD